MGGSISSVCTRDVFYSHFVSFYLFFEKQKQRRTCLRVFRESLLGRPNCPSWKRDGRICSNAALQAFRSRPSRGSAIWCPSICRILATSNSPPTRNPKVRNEFIINHRRRRRRTRKKKKRKEKESENENEKARDRRHWCCCSWFGLGKQVPPN